MPYMHVYKGWDDKWHKNPCVKTKPEIGHFVLLKGEPPLKLGGGPEFGCDESPPLTDMCPIVSKFYMTTPTCPKCKAPMTVGKILEGSYDVHGWRGIIQYDPPPSSGRLEDCFKCQRCGHSELHIWIKSPTPAQYIEVNLKI